MIHDFVQAYRTRAVLPPTSLAHCFFGQIEPFLEYVRLSPYHWELTKSGYRGVLDRGFGRTYVIEYSCHDRKLTLMNSKDQRFRFLFFTRTIQVQAINQLTLPEDGAVRLDQLEAAFATACAG